MISAVMMMALSLPADAATTTRRFAVLASSNNGGPERIELRYANDDASTMAEVFENLGGVDPKDEVFLRNADRTDISAALSDVSAQIQQAEADGFRTELVFYYSGHSDETGLLPEGELYEYQDLKDDLEAIPVDVKMVVLDSCASGALVRTKGGKMMNSFLVDESVDVTGHAYLTSSSADEAAQESDKIGGSFFTHYLVSGMRGGADTSGDGLVTLSEVYTFAKDETFARTERSQAGPQHPNWAVDLAGQGDLVVSDISNATSGLVMGEGTEGRLYVRDGADRLVAELYKPASRELSLVLKPGDYSVLLMADEEMSEARFTVHADERINLDDLLFKSVKGLNLLARAKGNDEKPTREVPLWFGIVPPMGRKDTLHHMQVSLGAAGATRIDGMQVSLGANFVKEDMKGLQGTVGINTAGDVNGVQGSVGGNFATGDVVGLQTSVGINTAGGDVKGVQGTVGANYAEGKVNGVQASVGGNLAVGPMKGVQLSVGPSIANDFEGLQGAMINIGKNVKGLQLGLVNVGGKVDTQIGLVNVAKDAKHSIGLITINGSGYNHIQVFASESEVASIGFTYGGKVLYTHAQIGLRGQPNQNYPRLTSLAGLGVHRPIGSKAYADFDVGVGAFQRRYVNGNGNVLVRGRVTVGFELAPHLALFAGPTVNYFAYSSGDDVYRVTSLGGDGKLHEGDVWMGGQVGIRF